MKQVTINYTDGSTEHLEAPHISEYICEKTTNFVLKDESGNKIREVRVYNDKIKSYEQARVPEGEEWRKYIIDAMKA